MNNAKVTSRFITNGIAYAVELREGNHTVCFLECTSEEGALALTTQINAHVIQVSKE